MKNPKKAFRRLVCFGLDRPGTRWLLAAIATWYARRATGKDVSIFYDEFWIHRIEDRFLSDFPLFNYYGSDICSWGTPDEAYVNDAADYWFYRYSPRPGHVIIDIGAGVGTDVHAFSKAVGPTGRVLALEAHPTTFLGLVKTCKWNRLDNVICEQVAVMDKPGTVDIQDSDDDKSNATGTGSGKTVRVASVTLDQLCEKHGIRQIDFLKINIEGAERWALLGMERVLRNTASIAVACHDFRAQRGDGDHFATLDFVRPFLQSNGFNLETRDTDQRPYVRDHIHGRRSLVSHEGA